MSIETEAAKALESTVTNVAYGGGGVAVIMGIWLGTIQNKLRSVTTLWTKFDNHVEKVATNREKDAREYATQLQVERAVSRLEKAMNDLGLKIDKVLEKRDCE